MEQIEQIRELLDELLNEQLNQITLSGPLDANLPIKIRIRPLIIRKELVFQAALWDGRKERHLNLEREEILLQIQEWISSCYKQLQAESDRLTASVLVSKKGKVSLKKRYKAKRQDGENASGAAGSEESSEMRSSGIKPSGPASQVNNRVQLSNNRVKNYILPEGIPVPFLVDLGVMTKEGKVVSSRYDKFRQINRFLEFIRDVVPALPQTREITVIDFGCGKSYLTFAMYYYLHELLGLKIRVIGLDLKEDVILHCGELAKKYGYDKLTFLTGDIADYDGVDHVDMVVTLHACDTATDYALAKAVAWGAGVILSVPCCHHELNRKIESELLEPILQYGILKERMSALITDGLRAELLKQNGYQVQVLEFIDMEHTPKNILLRAVYPSHPKIDRGKEMRDRKLRECIEGLNASLTLEKLLAQKPFDKE